jgi:iduronate 2-sulfatase
MHVLFRVLSLAGLLLFPEITLAAEKMNVLFLVSDDLTAHCLGCYGHPQCQSPNLDNLAGRGVRFERAYCQFPLCNPSRSSFLTGLRPDQLRIYENATQIRKTVPDVQTLPQTFRKGGYFVARVGKLYHYGVPGQIGTSGLDDPASWDQVVNPRGKDKDDEEADKIFTLRPELKGSARYGGVLSWFASDGRDDQQTDGIAAAETIRLLAANKNRPFFLACGFYRPHTPYVAPIPYFERYPLSKIPLPVVPKDHWNSAPKLAFGSHKKEHDLLTDDLRRQAIQAYFASTTFMDAQVGLVLDALEKEGLAKNTIVVFLSDHGYHLGEHGLWQKMSLFENSARVPLIIYDPRAKGNGKACSRTVELVDLHPTLAELCGLPPPAGLTGKSLKPLLDDPGAAWDKPAITQVSRGTPQATGEKVPQGQKLIMGYSVRDERYRYTEWNQGQLGTQLYDYQSDPGELTNLAGNPQFAEVVKRLKAYLPRP